MPLDLAALERRQATVTVRYGDEEFAVHYRPDRYTIATHVRLGQLRQEPGFDPLVDVLADLLVAWDVTEAGQPVKPTRETLAGFPLLLLLAIANAVMESMVPNLPNAADSGAG